MSRCVAVLIGKVDVDALRIGSQQAAHVVDVSIPSTIKQLFTGRVLLLHLCGDFRVALRTQKNIMRRSP